jgi:DnaJ family protein C protein 28
MASWNEFAREQIEEAVKSGRWKDLPGKGQPLDLSEDTSVPPHLRLGNKILKDANMVPEWVSASQDIHALHASTLRKRETLWAAGKNHALSKAPVFEAWRHEARLEWERAMHAFNRVARNFEWKAPRAAGRPAMFIIEDELKEFDQFFPRRP